MGKDIDKMSKEEMEIEIGEAGINTIRRKVIEERLEEIHKRQRII